MRCSHLMPPWYAFAVAVVLWALCRTTFAAEPFCGEYVCRDEELSDLSLRNVSSVLIVNCSIGKLSVQASHLVASAFVVADSIITETTFTDVTLAQSSLLLFTGCSGVTMAFVRLHVRTSSALRVEHSQFTLATAYALMSFYNSEFNDSNFIVLNSSLSSGGHVITNSGPQGGLHDGALMLVQQSTFRAPYLCFGLPLRVNTRMVFLSASVQCSSSYPLHGPNVVHRCGGSSVFTPDTLTLPCEECNVAYDCNPLYTVNVAGTPPECNCNCVDQTVLEASGLHELVLSSRCDPEPRCGSEQHAAATPTLTLSTTESTRSTTASASAPRTGTDENASPTQSVTHLASTMSPTVGATLTSGTSASATVPMDSPFESVPPSLPADQAQVLEGTGTAAVVVAAVSGPSAAVVANTVSMLAHTVNCAVRFDHSDEQAPEWALYPLQIPLGSAPEGSPVATALPLHRGAVVLNTVPVLVLAVAWYALHRHGRFASGGRAVGFVTATLYAVLPQGVFASATVLLQHRFGEASAWQAIAVAVMAMWIASVACVARSLLRDRPRWEASDDAATQQFGAVMGHMVPHGAWLPVAGVADGFPDADTYRRGYPGRFIDGYRRRWPGIAFVSGWTLPPLLGALTSIRPTTLPGCRAVSALVMCVLVVQGTGYLALGRPHAIPVVRWATIASCTLLVCMAGVACASQLSGGLSASEALAFTVSGVLAEAVMALAQLLETAAAAIDWLRPRPEASSAPSSSDTTDPSVATVALSADTVVSVGDEEGLAQPLLHLPHVPNGLDE